MPQGSQEGSSDEQILADMLRQHSQPLLRVLMKQTRDRDLANEVLQDTFTALLRRRHLHRLREPKKYLFRVALRMLSRRKREANRDARTVVFDSEAMHAAADGPSADGKDAPDPLQQVFLAEVAEYIQLLPPNYQQVLNMRMQGYRNVQIAEVLKATPAAVAQLLARARRMLQETMSTTRQGAVKR